MQRVVQRTIGVALAALALGISSTGALAQNVIKIGAPFSLSGPFASFGQAGSAGVEMAVEELNRRGGITVGNTKYTVQMISEDTRSQVADTVSIMERLTREQKVAAVFGPIVGVLSTPGQEVTQAAKTIHFGPAVQWNALMGRPDKKYLVHTQVDDDLRYGAFVPLLVRETKIKSIALLGVNDATARSIMPKVAALMQKEGVKVVAEEYFERTTTDFSPFLTRIRSQKPDMLFFGYGDNFAVSILRQGVELNVAPHYSAFAGTSLTVPMQQALGKPVDSFIGMVANENLLQPLHDDVTKWIVAYKAKYNKDPAGTTDWAFSMYDYVFIWARAVQQAGTFTDSDKVIEKIRNTNYKGVLNIKIDGRGQADHDYDVGIIRNGKLTWQHVNVIK